jgi:transcriptional regulator
VHAYGRAEVFHDGERIERILSATVNRFETYGWKNDLPADFRAKLIAAIVGFEIKIERIEAKFKLSQNRKPEDYGAVLREFSCREDENSRALLKYMRLSSG